MDARFHVEETLDASGCALPPGLVDAHIHTPLAIVRGVAQDVRYWMQRALAPYSRHITPEAALAGSHLNVLEALKAGTTTYVDYTRPFPGWAEFFARVGVRARLTPTINALRTGGMAGWKVGDLYPFDEAYGQKAIDDMATKEGAKAIGLGDEIGSLEVGKQADLILVDLIALNLSPVLEAPVRNIVPNLVYAASGHEVKTVMVAGKILVRDGVVLTADEEVVRAEAQIQAEAVTKRVAADPVHKEMALLEAMQRGQL